MFVIGRNRIACTATFLLVGATLAATGCGSTVSKSASAAPPQTTAAATTTATEAAPTPPSLLKAAHLAADNVRPGEIIIKQSGTANRGPYAFRPGVYRVRFQQWTSSGEVDFTTEASSLVVQLDRKPGDIGAETVTVFNATQGSGSNQITVPGGEFYVDVSSEDYGLVLRFTPAP
jgi:hypothetical protein